MFRPARLLTLAFALGMACPLGAFSQERIALFTQVDRQTALVEIDATVSGFGTILSTTTLNDVSTSFSSPPVALAGGRYLTWLAAGPNQAWDLVVFDRRTKRHFYAGVPTPTDPYGLSFATDLLADRKHPRVFYRTGGGRQSGVWSLDARSPIPRRLFSMTTEGFVTSMTLAEDAEELFVGMFLASGPPYYQIVVIDAVDGRELRRLPREDSETAFPVEAILAVDPAGTTLLLQEGFGIIRRDARTGARLPGAPDSGGATSALGGFDAERNRLLVLDYRALRALDATTLAEQWRTPLGVVSNSRSLYVARVARPGRWMTGAYIARAETRVIQPPFSYYSGEYTCNAINVDVFEPDGTMRTTVDVMATLAIPGGNGGCSAYPVLVRSPFAPRALSTTTEGRAVTVSWGDPGDTEEFELEYGFASGQRAGSLRLAAGTTRLTIPNVPSGIYYVRVKAVNEVGPSPASNEVRVVVP